MATIPSIDSNYGATKISAPKVRVALFNDGYQQRIKFGLNIDPKICNLNCTNITTTQATTIEDFLEARADDGASFDWTPPDSSTSYKWTVTNWNKTLPYSNLANISATFTQVFEP